MTRRRTSKEERMNSLLRDEDDDDPYSLAPPRASSDEPTVTCFGEKVLHEVWCIKRSRWLQQWRQRWLVLTFTRILTFKSCRGYALGEEPTEEFAVQDLQVGSVRALLGDEAASHLEFGVHTLAVRAILILTLPQRDLVLDLAPAAAGGAVNGGAAVSAAARDLALMKFASAVVNARCALRTRLPCYELLGCVHSFEARGVASFKERVAIGSELGRGAFGTVYQGRCLQLGRPVAIKQVRLLNQERRERMAVEVAIMRSVRHPHVVAILNYHETWSHAHIVMELLPGGDLYSQVIERYWQGHDAAGYSEREVREIVRMALSGLEALHHQRVVHRDLKPENVLLIDRRGGLLDLRIADFGAAQALAPGEQCLERAGSPGYMAPEVLAGRPYDLAVDLWSLGVILYTLLCGRPPFEWGGADEEAAVLRGAWSFADANWYDVSAEAKDAVRALLAHEPEARPRVHEVLQLPWVRPSAEPASVTRRGSSLSVGGVGERDAPPISKEMIRVGSLPGSASLLELRGLAGGGSSGALVSPSRPTLHVKRPYGVVEGPPSAPSRPYVGKPPWRSDADVPSVGRTGQQDELIGL